MPVAEAARLLGAASGGVVTEEMLRADIDAGAPTNPDGTIHMMRYARWSVARLLEMERTRGATF